MISDLLFWQELTAGADRHLADIVATSRNESEYNARMLAAGVSIKRKGKNRWKRQAIGRVYEK